MGSNPIGPAIYFIHSVQTLTNNGSFSLFAWLIGADIVFPAQSSVPLEAGSFFSGTGNGLDESEPTSYLLLSQS